MRLREKLKKLDACPEALQYVGDREDVAALWAECRRGDHMLWLASRLDRQRVVLTAADTAELAVQRHWRGDETLALAISAARAWVADPTEVNRMAAEAAAGAARALTRAASWASAWASARASARAAASAAAAAASRAAEVAASAVAWTAVEAADAAEADAAVWASVDAAWACSLAESAEIVRRHFSGAEIAEFLEGV